MAWSFTTTITKNPPRFRGGEVSELERELSRSTACRARFVCVRTFWHRRFVHRLADAEEVQRLGFNERQPVLEDFFAATGEAPSRSSTPRRAAG